MALTCSSLSRLPFSSRNSTFSSLTAPSGCWTAGGARGVTSTSFLGSSAMGGALPTCAWEVAAGPATGTSSMAYSAYCGHVSKSPCDCNVSSSMLTVL